MKFTSGSPQTDLKPSFLGHYRPPVAHYRLIDPGIHFYAEFLTALKGGAVGRTGKQNATQRIGGVSSQNLRYIELLLAAPWSLGLSETNGFPLANETRVQVANPVSFLAQKILIHRRRNREERAKDIVYMHDTIDTFRTRIHDLSTEWVSNIRHELHANAVRTVERGAGTLFGNVTDAIRAASRITQGRNLTPEVIRETCDLGFVRSFSTWQEQTMTPKKSLRQVPAFRQSAWLPTGEIRSGTVLRRRMNHQRMRSM